MLYVGSYSRIVYNGNISGKIMLERSCRQGDPLSPYIFLIVIEYVLEMIRNNVDIRGVRLGHAEYKISAYADDVLCFLDGSINSCRALFNDLGIFAKYSGLKPNITKTQAFWAGVGGPQESEGIKDKFPFKWTNQLKVLGITFSNNEQGAHEENFESKLRTIQRTMNSWKRRHITVRGKITLIKALLLPKLTHVFISLPKPPVDFLKRLKTALCNFLWNGKVDRLRRLSVCKQYKNGGLEMVEVDTYIEALKATWVRREMRSKHSWTKLFQECVSKKKYLWEMNGDSLIKMSKQVDNIFWAEVLRAFANVSRAIKVDAEEMNRWGLWHSDLTKHKTTCISAWRKRGLRYLNDIVDDGGQIITFQQAKQQYMLRGSYLDYIGLIGSLSREWKALPRRTKVEYPIIHPQVQLVLSREKGAKYLYNIMLEKKIESVSNSWEARWESKFGGINWLEIYGTIYQNFPVYYHILNYKIITQIIATNRMLYAMGIKSTPVCDRCNMYTETIIHKFWDCQEVKRFWKDIAEFINSLSITGNAITFSPREIILGEPNDIFVNIIVSVGKMVIMKQTRLCIDQFVNKLKIYIMNEKCAAQTQNRRVRYAEIWGRLDDALQNRG